MKITARAHDSRSVALDCQPWPSWRKSYTIYAEIYESDSGYVWATKAGRKLNAKELAAIERVPPGNYPAGPA